MVGPRSVCEGEAPASKAGLHGRPRIGKRRGSGGRPVGPREEYLARMRPQRRGRPSRCGAMLEGLISSPS